MYWYHTGLTATHPSQSPAITWPLNFKPVWFFVEYGENTISNIYALGNPIILWFGLLAVFFTFSFYLVSKNKNLKYLLIAYGIFWLPWIASPRCMLFSR